MSSLPDRADARHTALRLMGHDRISRMDAGLMRLSLKLVCPPHVVSRPSWLCVDPAEPRAVCVFELLPLSALRSGQRARVDQIVGQPEHVHRLEELGLRHGAEIEMVQSGSPCIIRLGGGKLCFRADEATSVLVREGSGS